MRYLLLPAFLALLMALPSWGAPIVSTPSPTGPRATEITFPLNDLADSQAIGVSGYCSVRAQIAGSDSISLYAVTTATTAASSGTLIRTFTASTTTAVTFTAGTRWVKAVSTTASTGGSVMTIECAPMTGGGAASTFLVEDFAGGSPTGGIQEALDACEDAGTGLVILPAGTTTIDATSITSPIITLPASSYATNHRALCSLVGFGAAHGANQYAVNGGSEIKVENSGSKVVMRVTGGGQTLSDFSLYTPDISSGGIAVQIASSTVSDPVKVLGEVGVDNWSLSNVSIIGDAEGVTGDGEGTGLQLQFALKGIVDGGTINGFAYGVDFADVAATADNLQNNVNVFKATKIRINDIGLRLHDTLSAQDLTLVGATIEGNQVGMSVALSEVKVTDLGSHWENGCVAGCSGAINIRLGTSGGAVPEPMVYYGFNPFLGGVAAGLDIVREHYNAAWLSDVMIGGTITSGVTYSDNAKIRSVLSPWWYADGASGAQGDSIVPPSWTTGCSDYGTYADHVSGTTCWDETANVLSLCEAGADGICDSASEWNAASTLPTTSTQSATPHAPTAGPDFADRNFLYTNAGAVVVNLPTVDAVGDGKKACFHDLVGTAANLLEINPDNGDGIRLGGTLDTDGDSIDTNTAVVGDYVCLLARDNGTSDEWLVMDRSGTWAAN